MDKEIIGAILESLKKGFQRKSRYVKGHSPVDMARENCRKISENAGKVAFVDGGSSEILGSANFSLLFIRLCSTVYEGSKKLSAGKTEFYLLVSSMEKEGKMIYTTKVFGADIDFGDISLDDESLKQGDHDVEAANAGSACRRIAELMEAERLVNRDIDAVVIDGSLEAGTGREKKVMEGLLSKGMKEGVIVAGLSKTCRLFTDTGDNAAAAIAREAHEKEWYYHPLWRSDEPFDTFLAKLNERSSYVFRIDICREQRDHINALAGMLRQNSTDPVFIGYPYGLVEADRAARVGNKEKEFLKMQFAVRAGKDWQTISQYLNSANAHDVLDNIG